MWAFLQLHGIPIDRVNPDISGYIDLDKFQFVDELLKRVEIKQGIIIDFQSQQPFHGFHGQLGTATRQLVDFTKAVGDIDAFGLFKPGHTDPKIARDGQQSGRHS